MITVRSGGRDSVAGEYQAGRNVALRHYPQSLVEPDDLGPFARRVVTHETRLAEACSNIWLSLESQFAIDSVQHRQDTQQGFSDVLLYLVT